MSLEVIFEAGEWPNEASAWAEVSQLAVFEALNLEPSFEIAILLSNDARIQELNKTYRHQDKATNILSWPSVEYERMAGQPPQALEEVQESLGDLALAYETCVNEAELIGLEHHFKHLIVHGILHLLGYDHEQDHDALQMEGLEIGILARLNIANPYEDRDDE